MWIAENFHVRFRKVHVKEIIGAAHRIKATSVVQIIIVVHTAVMSMDNKHYVWHTRNIASDSVVLKRNVVAVVYEVKIFSIADIGVIILRNNLKVCINKLAGFFQINKVVQKRVKLLVSRWYTFLIPIRRIDIWRQLRLIKVVIDICEKNLVLHSIYHSLLYVVGDCVLHD